MFCVVSSFPPGVCTGIINSIVQSLYLLFLTSQQAELKSQLDQISINWIISKIFAEHIHSPELVCFFSNFLISF